MNNRRVRVNRGKDLIAMVVYTARGSIPKGRTRNSAPSASATCISRLVSDTLVVPHACSAFCPTQSAAGGGETAPAWPGSCHGAEGFSRGGHAASAGYHRGRDPESPPQPGPGRCWQAEKERPGCERAHGRNQRPARANPDTGENCCRARCPPGRNSLRNSQPTARQPTRWKQRGAERGTSPLGPHAAVQLQSEAALG